jgi:hypothetical protein
MDNRPTQLVREASDLVNRLHERWADELWSGRNANRTARVYMKAVDRCERREAVLTVEDEFAEFNELFDLNGRAG